MSANPPNRSFSHRSGKRRSLPPAPLSPQPTTFLQPDSAALTSQGRPRAATGPPAHQARSSSTNKVPSHESQPQSKDDTDGEDGDDEISEPGSDLVFGISDVSDGYETSLTENITPLEARDLSRHGSQGGIDDQLCYILARLPDRNVEDEKADELGNNSDALEEDRLVRETPALVFQDRYEATKSDIEDGWASKDERSVSACSRAQSPASFQAVEDEDIQTRLMTARKMNPKTKDPFYPRGTFRSVITPDCVTQELRRAFPNEDDDRIVIMAHQICHGMSEERSTERNDGCFRRIFAILALTGLIPEIIHFLNAGINDSNLPLSKIDRPNRPMTFDLCLRGSKDTAIEFTTRWKCVHTDSFWNSQWAMLSPLFGKCKARKKVWHYKLKRRVVLPYVKTEVTSQVHNGGFAQVSRVCIHDKHHDFHKGKSFSGSFALKKLKSESREDFEREVDMLKKFRDEDDHLISLLVTYEHNDSFFLLFDWARCNLKEYWASIQPSPDPNDRDTVLWVVDQCKGISHGILKLHQYRTSTFNSENRQMKEIYGHHGDIKEANILWFPEFPDDPRPNTGHMKLADFGVAGFSTQHTGSLGSNGIFMATPSYRAPESDLTRPRAPGRSFDIWTLGILYLQFVTWMLGGQALLEKFDKKRESLEPGYPFETDIFFERIKTTEDPPGIGKGYKIKDAVIDFFKELHRHPKCTQFLHELLDMIEEELLIVRPTDPNAKDRIQAAELHGRWTIMSSKCLKDEAYALVPVPWGRKRLS